MYIYIYIYIYIIYHKKLAYLIMKSGEFHDLLSISWRPRKAGESEFVGMITTELMVQVPVKV